ncbi:glycoside hydrolase family 3 protein [Daldinia caldariorum]|uniref:glycoside hydrolase family 3 protein n=1 Tax=Daldinia caldariorum TaxID=326644 RepID=UPI0020072A80|nr:glycoside hydrolase family 3 protein [Daldinia caldariorum]KAI1472379.1 glycoside hydrolase family 3 protein [Daldinia caldariorum]
MASVVSLSITALLIVKGVVAKDFPNCQSGPLASNQVCNTTLDPWSRAAALVAQFTHDEKISNSWDNSPGVSRLGVPSYEWWNEALHGVASSPGVQFASSGNFSYATSFPQPITMGAAFDMPLIRSVAETTSTEARAFSNAGRAGLNFWTPNINPFRDPRWGRGQEVPSEDPYHAAQYVLQLIPGLQGGLSADPYYKLVATCKHYAGYDMENWKGNRRYAFDAKISSQDLQDYYLAPFRACVRDANALSVMCSYNAVNGVPTCADPWLLEDVLRGLYGFSSEDRWVTADCDALQNVWTDHRYGSSAEGAAAASLNAGTDLDCGQFWPQNLPAAYSSRLFNDTVLDRSLIRRYASMVRLGWFDPPAQQPYRQLGWDAVAKPEARALALRAAQEGIVLLKNNGSALPLAKAVKRVAVVGPLGTATTQMQGNYYGRAQNISTVVSAFQAAGYETSNAPGCALTGSSTSGFAAALSAAQAADAVVFVGGIDISIEGEERDREQITWPGRQVDLIKQLAAANGDKPIVVVQMGTVLDSSEIKAHAGVDALLWAGYPGQDGGAAVVSILTGEKAPAGRLPVTQYPGDYVNQVDMTNMNLQSGTENPGRTYKWYTKEPVFPFGHGLHYTSFNVSLPADLPTTFTTADLTSNISFTQTGPVASGNYPDLAPFVSIPVSVTNTGTTTSDYVVLAFLKGEYGPEPYPLKSLVGFARLHDIEPGESGTGTGTLELKLGAVARSDRDGSLTLWPGKYRLVLDIDDRAAWDFEITGEQVMLEKLPPKRS